MIGQELVLLTFQKAYPIVKLVSVTISSTATLNCIPLL